jgi:hypothetical protein
VRTRPLREASLRELRPLLDEECSLWQSELGWDFSDVRAAVGTGIDRGSLPGRVVIEGSRASAYCYYMVDAGRVIIGSIFAGREHRARGIEDALVSAVVVDARGERGSGRVECQTLFCTSDAVDRRFESAGFSSRLRHYMRRDLRGPLPPRDPLLPGGVALRPLRREDLPAAADIVYRSHVGTVDAALNLTYATPATCRAFVETLVLRSGCGRFDADASRLAEGPRGPVAVLVASRLAAANGHVCQVSVTPEAQGRAISAALSVTVSNDRAQRLYELLGFRTQRTFAAHAWLRPPAKIELPA